MSAQRSIPGDGSHPRSPVLVADSDALFCAEIAGSLRACATPTVEVIAADEIQAAMDRHHFDVALVGEFGEGGEAALRIVRQLRSRSRCSVIFTPKRGTELLAIEAMRAGTSDYLRRPVSRPELLACVERCRRPVPSAESSRLVCASEKMQSTVHFLTKVSKTDSNVFITGETGTGKEAAARLLHERSARAGQPLVYINCAALPDSLFESEMFGYERGAFTGAAQPYAGQLRIANGGTVVLDEIGEMSLFAQAKLLRTIESRRVSPLGAQRSVALDVRIIAATNQDPESLMRERRFRPDLFFRLNVARVHLAPLRERTADILPLFEHYVTDFSRRTGMRAPVISADARACLLRYNFPGNVRELRNIVEAIFIDPPAEQILPEHLPEQLRQVDGHTLLHLGERERLIAALSATQWNRTEAAKMLGWSRMTLYRKMLRYEVSHCVT
jgi:DNA-binding NtrC family response regulator